MIPVTLLASFLQEVVIPEVAIVFRAHQNAGLPPPTSEQVLAALGADADKGIAVGEAWLKAHPAGAAAAAPTAGSGG